MRKIRRRIKIRWDRIKIGSKEAKISTEKAKGLCQTGAHVMGKDKANGYR